MTDNDQHRFSEYDQETVGGEESLSTREVAGLKKPRPAASPDTVTLYLPERDDPLVFIGKKQILIGRRDKKLGIEPDIDLNNDHGVMLGISRKHAEIRIVQSVCYLVDLDSTNGTWVNEIQLQPYRPQPLQSGDQIRLGQLVMLVYLAAIGEVQTAAAEAVPSAGQVYPVTSVKLVPQAGVRLFETNGISFSFMTDVLSNYLKAVQEIHEIIRDAQRESVEPLVINNIMIQIEDKSILLDIRGGKDLIEFMSVSLSKFVQEYQDENLPNNMDTQISPVNKRTSIHTDALYENAANYMLEELVFRFLENRRPVYVKNLALQLQILYASSLQMIPG